MAASIALKGHWPAPGPRPASSFRYVPDGKVRGWYFWLLLLLAPIQSVLLTPIQGTTPAFLLTLGAMFALMGAEKRYFHVLLFYGGFVLLYAIYLAIGLYGYTIDQPDMSQLTVIREVYIYGELKQTHVTQGIYLMTALLFAFIVYEYFQESFVKWAFFGILLIAAYGFYEFIYYAIFQENGDFLSNRNFGDLDTAAAGAGDGDFATGSMFQTSNVFGNGFMRLKSLVGEPSMYALTVTPFVVYAFARSWWWLFGILFLSIALSTSTTALIGLAVGIGYVEVRQRQEFILYIAAFLIIATLLYFTSSSVQLAADRLVFDKLDTASGTERTAYFVHHASVVFDSNLVRSLFGLGFGTVRSTDMMSNLLANIGIVGFGLYSALFIAPCFLLRGGPDRDAVIGALLAVYFMEILTVSEYSYLPPWFIVALAYARLREQRRQRLLPAPT